MQLKRLLTPVLVVVLVSLTGAGCGRVSMSDTDSESNTPKATQVSTDNGSKIMRASKTFAEVARGNQSTAKARVVDIDASKGDGTETVTFTFADTKVLPKYLVKYVDAIRDHPEDDPLALEGNAFLQVGFALTNPNTQGRLAVPVDMPVGQPQIQEVLLARNVGGDMSFGIGLQRKAEFRVTELSKPTRLVVEVRTK